MLAWHFAETQMRDGTQLGAPGETEIFIGKLGMCTSGLHASEKLIDALGYAPGPLLRRVRLGGEIITEEDKAVASQREILWECDMTAALQLFARQCALDVIHLWNPPAFVVEFLMGGDEKVRDAAGDAAGAVAGAADQATARAAAWATAWATDRDALNSAWDAAWGAAWAARNADWAAWNSAKDKQEKRLIAYAQAARAGLFLPPTN